LFAKSNFSLKSGQRAIPVPLFDIRTRAKWWLRSLTNAQFMRFIIVTIIETLSILMLLDTLIKEFDRRKLFIEKRELRNFFLLSVASLAIFLLFGNVLRFDWAYSEEGNFHLTANMFMWVSLTLIMYLIYRNVSTIRHHMLMPKDEKAIEK
jgi:hypothetical protein